MRAEAAAADVRGGREHNAVFGEGTG